MLDVIKGMLFGNKQSIEANEIKNSTIFQISGDVNNYGYNDANSLTEVGGNKLISRMVSFNIDNLCTLLLKMKIQELKQELNIAFSYGLSKLSDSDKEKIYFLRFCQSLHDSEIENCQVALDFLSGNYRDEALWLKNNWDRPFEIDINDHIRHLPEIQILIIDRLFSVGNFKKIIDIYNRLILTGEDKIALTEIFCTQLKYYCGLAMFNTGSFNDSFEIFKDLKKLTSEEKFDFFFNIVKVQKANVNCVDERNETELVQAKQELDTVENKYPDLAKVNEELISYLKLLTYFNLGRIKVCYLDNIKEIFQGFSQKIKELDLIKFYFGLCLELREEFEQAISCYLSSEWQKNPNTSIRLLLCYVRMKDYNNIVLKYDELQESAITLQHKGVLLLAYYYKNDASYHEKLQDALKTVNKSFEDLFHVANYVFDEETFEEYIVKTINEMLDLGVSFNGVENYILSGYIYMFLHFRKMNFLMKTLDEIASLSILSNEITYDIFYFFNEMLKQMNESDGLDTQPEIKTIERISDRFIKENVAKNLFLS